MWRHRRLFFNPRYQGMGLLIYPYFFFVELLAPVMESLGLIGLVVGLLAGLINLPFAILFFLVAYGYGLLLSAFTLLLEELSFHRHESIRDRLILLGWALLENLGYRHLSVAWRLRGMIKYLRGRTEWGAMTRRGFSNPASVPKS
jgi:hypothetical protein